MYKGFHQDCKLKDRAAKPIIKGFFFFAKQCVLICVDDDLLITKEY